MIEVRATAFGLPAAEALRDELARHKSEDPLAPVTVLVPTNYLGVSVRRRLAMGDPGTITTRGRGVAGIDLLTVYRLAELLGAPLLSQAGRRPVSNPVVAASVRRALGADPGVFTGVADHPSTERSLVRVHRELRDLTSAQQQQLATASTRAADVVRVHRDVDHHLVAAWYDEFDLLAAATEVVTTEPHRVRQLGHVVLHLPQELSQAAAAFLRALTDAVGVTCIVGVTGDNRTDSAAAELVSRLGSTLPTAEVEPAHADRIITVSDADDEVRTVVREIVTDLDTGVPLERIGVLYGSTEPYARLLDEQLEAAGLARNGNAVRSVAESVVGRSALALLALPDRGFRRTDVFELLATAPIRRTADQRHLAPVSAWERVARTAGVIGGVDEWQLRLGHHQHDRRLDITRVQRSEPDHPRVAAYTQEIALATGLAEFVDELAARLDATHLEPTWSHYASWVRELLLRYLGPTDDETWPEAERLAADQVDRTLDRLAGLDSIEPQTSLTVFRRTLELEFDSGLGRVGQVGQGIFVGRVAQAFGMDLDRLYMVGMSEGTFPARRRDDSLLPDHERALTGGALALRSADVDEQHRFFLAALASTAGRRTLLFPRGDLRRSAEQVPSRWLLDTAAALGGGRFDGNRLETAAHDPAQAWIREVPSFVAGLRSCAFPATQQEYDLISLMRRREDGEPLADHHLHRTSRAFARGVELTEARASRQFTRFDGNLVGIVTDEGVGIDVLAPTRLEDWAACPHRYLMRAVLRVGEIDTPDSILRISPLDRGNLMHDALDEFFTQAPDAGLLPEPTEPFRSEAHDALAEIAATVADQLEGRGLVGKQIFWQRDRRDIMADLDELLRQDAQRERRGRLVGSELGFGVPGADLPPVGYTLANGKEVRFRGSVDRLEQTASGRLIVIDYKTGGDTRFRGLSQENPDLAGTKLQLPVYALAARSAIDDARAPVHAAYWFVTEKKGRWKWLGLDVDDGVMRRFDEVVTTIVDGIERGVFPSRPREHDNPAFVECPYCDPDGLGTSELRTQWVRKRQDPLLTDYLALAEPEALPDV